MASAGGVPTIWPARGLRARLPRGSGRIGIAARLGGWQAPRCSGCPCSVGFLPNRGPIRFPVEILGARQRSRVQRLIRPVRPTRNKARRGRARTGRPPAAAFWRPISRTHPSYPTAMPIMAHRPPWPTLPIGTTPPLFGISQTFLFLPTEFQQPSHVSVKSAARLVDGMWQKVGATLPTPRF
jgi:hypothetical protein